MGFKEILEASLKEGIDVAEINKGLESYTAAYFTENAQGLSKNNKEIIEEKRKLKEEYDNLKERYKDFENGEITYEQYTDLKNGYETLKASADPNVTDEKLKEQYERGKKQRETELNPKISNLEIERERIAKERENYKKRYIDYALDNKLKSTLNQIDNLEYTDRWYKGLKADVKTNYNDQEDKFSPTILSNGVELPLEDWVKTFPNTDEGKKMIKAPTFSGANAHGGVSASNAKLADLSKASTPQERNAILKANGYDV